ncbi:hypothetical protein NHX12_018595 [Muraenolepis orangiensis]|uniref:Pericentriolar material 1 protein C-terminal domain-containing protein n=1 Tax=Muraenolepis orangiensis TaxID=630683 RepID=A0A9Q0IVI4_9TELE|nr:hypothetical protein NHX12_018595 [Muraenolepis orangiensis]
MATGGAPLDDAEEQELHNWANGSLEDRLNNMDWGVQQKKANRSSEKNRKEFSAAVAESRLTNDISPESTPGAGRRRARIPHSFPQVKYTTQMSVPEQADLERLRQQINFIDLDEISVGSDSQGRVTAANNQRQLPGENKKPYNFLPIHFNTNKSKGQLASPGSTSTPPTPASAKKAKKQSPVVREPLGVLFPGAFSPGLLGSTAAEHSPLAHRQFGREEPCVDSSQVVGKLVQIREFIGKASSMRDDLLEKKDVAANARENEQDNAGTLDSAVGSSSLAESTSLNMESSVGPVAEQGDKKEELENMHKQRELMKKMIGHQEQLRSLQSRQAALLAMQRTAEQAIAAMDDTEGVTEPTGSVSGVSITSELNDELNDLIQRFHNQLHDSQVEAVPDNRRRAECLSLSREVFRSRAPLLAVGPPTHRPLLHSASGPHVGLARGAAAALSGGTKPTKLQELKDKKQTMDKILQELHSLRDQTLNNSCHRMSTQRSPSMGSSTDYTSALSTNAASTSFQPPLPQHQEAPNSTDKLRKLKEFHKRLNALRELVQYYEQTSDMIVDTVNENVKEDDEEDGTEDGSLFDTMFDSDLENRRQVANMGGNWADLNTLTANVRVAQGSGGANNRDGRLNTECEINNRSAANLRSLNISSAIECQYNQALDLESEVSESSRRSSLGGDAEFAQKSDDTDGTTANEDEALHQQPNGTRDHVVFRTGANKKPGELALEKLYEEKLHQQQQELKQLHEERQRLIDIHGKIQDLDWACPDLQSSLPSVPSQRGPTKKLTAATSTSVLTKPPPSSSSHTTSAVLKATAPEAANASVTDKELWSEMRGHQIGREELRDRRKHLEALMAEHLRLIDPGHTSCRTDRPQEQPLSPSRDRRTMATWGSSTPGHLDEDYCLESAGADDEDGAESISSSDIHIYPTNRNLRSFKNQGSNLKPPAAFSGSEVSAPVTVRPKTRANHTVPTPRQIKVANQSGSQAGGMRRQENLCWASELSNQSNMLQGMLVGQNNPLPNNLACPQLHLVVHQLNQGYTQLAWQHNHVQWLKQETSTFFTQGMPFLSFPAPLQPPGSGFNLPGFNLNPLFPTVTPMMGGGSQGAAAPARPHSAAAPAGHEQHHMLDPNTSENFSSVDPTTFTKTFRAGCKASAQASLASRDKTPNPKTRSRRNKSHNKSTGDQESDSASSTAKFVQQRTLQPRQRDPNQSLLDTKTKPNDLSSEESSDFSLFDALRETIYSEVATLISQNESRPHFLIELFHELQLLNTDYLRQRVLYSLQEIVTRQLTEASMSVDQPSSPRPAAWATGSQSELTPSESMATCYNESERNARVKRDAAKRLDEGQSLGNSTISTSSNLELFTTDDLGGASGGVRCPRIDHQQLDRQIKDVMKEVIPFLKEHMEGVCSHQMLTTLCRMVLSLTLQNDESKEFVRLFHKQLGGILQDSLTKFVGRTLKDCGEDLLVETSEILYNELAFFSLMQDVDHNGGSAAAKLQNGTKPEQRREEYSGSTDTSEDQEDQESPLPLSISLSKAETQALTNYGSGEDDNEEELEEFESGPVEVQTSLQATAGRVEQPGVSATGSQVEDPEHDSFKNNDDKSRGSGGETPEVGDSTAEDDTLLACETEEVAEVEAEVAVAEAVVEAVADANTAASHHHQEDSKASSITSSADTDSPVMVSVDEMGSGNTSQKSDEEDFVKVEELPLQLSVMCEEELQKRIVDEQQSNRLSTELVDNTEALTGLVGNAQALKEPETGGTQSA